MSNGGSGSVIGALAHGLPVVVILMGAEGCLRCPGGALIPESAPKLHDESAALRDASYAISLIERLVAVKRWLLPD